MSHSTNKIIFYALALVAATLIMCSCSGNRMKYYRVATVETWLINPHNGIEVRSLDSTYHVGDTLVNTSNGMHLEIIKSVAE